MTAYEPEQGFREALTKLDLGDVDLIVTPAADAARWAEENGYRVTLENHEGNVIYEIHPGDRLE